MSTGSGQDAAGLELIRSLEELPATFARGCKPRQRWGLGLEYERLGVFRATARAIPYAGPRSVTALFNALVAENGWSPVREAERLIALTRGGSSITLEPGGQTELSSRIHTGLDEMRDEVCGFVQELNGHSEPMGIAWIGIGAHPFSRQEEIEWVPKARYGVMSQVLGRTGRLGHDMMKRTAGIQLNVDYASEADAAVKFQALMGAGPLITALFANSPLLGGEPSGSLSTRAAIWRETDPARCGMLPFAFEDRPLFRAYTDFALDTPMLFVVREGRWLPVDLPFRRFVQEGYQGLRAQRGDWDLHLTSLFPDIRLKQFLEARVADSGDAALAMAHAALIKGIIYDDEALRRTVALTADLTWDERLALHADVCRLGLHARAGSNSVLELARELVRLAAAGLERLCRGGHDDRVFLQPLNIILGDAESPAERLLALWDGALGRDPRRLVDYLAVVSLPCYRC